MADNDNPTAAAPAGAPTGSADPGHEQMVPQDKVNRLEAKWRREAEAAAAKTAELEAQIAKHAEAQKTESEKAIDKARKEGIAQTAAEYEVKIKSYRIDAELKLALQSRGLDPDLALIVKGKSEIKELEDIPTAIDEALAGKDWASGKPVVPTAQGGSPSGLSGVKTPRTFEELQRFVIANGHAAVTDEIWKSVGKGAWGS